MYTNTNTHAHTHTHTRHTHTFNSIPSPLPWIERTGPTPSADRPSCTPSMSHPHHLRRERVRERKKGERERGRKERGREERGEWEREPRGMSDRGRRACMRERIVKLSEEKRKKFQYPFRKNMHHAYSMQDEGDTCYIRLHKRHDFAALRGAASARKGVSNKKGK